MAWSMAFLIDADNIRAEMIASPVPEFAKVTDSIIIHFTHGYTVNEGCEFAKPTLGGYFGGHVEVEIDSFFYGHTNVAMPVHIFENNAVKNGRFEILSYQQWLFETEGDMMTSIVIPINRVQEGKLDSLIRVYTAESPYDYAFFGQRCTSFMACFLSKAGVLNKISESDAIKAFFYPRPLRYTLLEYAEKNHLEVRVTKGSSCRTWEGD